jgi:hypothetical protein
LVTRIRTTLPGYPAWPYGRRWHAGHAERHASGNALCSLLLTKNTALWVLFQAIICYDMHAFIICAPRVPLFHQWYIQPGRFLSLGYGQYIRQPADRQAQQLSGITR